MRLKQLEVSGFKSFASRTSLDFPSGITAIVGPNGCGKSNVVDAIRWVLGEQSPKHLRGASMEDVVFKGNERVAPVGMAQVSLTFENDPEAKKPTALDLDVSTLPAHFRDLSEITISRRYYRSGESEYYINKMPCRLKDVTELFLGTGVGSKAYAIIEQGRVEQLINAKPEDRRLFIEEAAGTTLYRSRKLAAERKMERTRENLLRVTDVLRELERQIQYLHRLAKKAEQYRTFQEEARGLDLTLSGLQRDRLSAARDAQDAELTNVRDNEAGLIQRLEELEAQRSASSHALSEAEAELSRLREQAAVLDSECRNLEQRAQLLGREVAERDRRAVQLDSDVAALTAQQSGFRDTLAREEELRRDYAQNLLWSEGELSRKEDRLASAKRASSEAQVQVESLKTAALAVAAREADGRNQRTSMQRRQDELKRQQVRLGEDLDRAAQRLAVLEKELSNRHLQLVELREGLRSAQGEKERRSTRVRVLSEERRNWERESTEAQTALIQVQSRLDSLLEIQRNYEGYQRGVRSILKESQPDGGVMGVVADVLEVPEQYERAVAAALGDRLQYVIVRDGADGVEAVSALREEDSGRGSFIPVEPRRLDLNGHGSRSMNGSTRRLIDLVKVGERFQNVAETLLGEVVLVPDLSTGLALWRRNGVYVTMVTPDGDTIDPNGVITGGSERPVEEEIVSRRRLLSELSAEATALQQRSTLASSELQRVLLELDEEQTALKGLDAEVHRLTLELLTAEKDVERLEGERPRWVDQLEVGRFNRRSAAAEEADCAARLAEIESTLAGLESERRSCEISLRGGQARLAWAQGDSETLAAEVTQLKVKVAEGRQRHEATVASLVRLQNQITEVASRLVTLREEHDRALRERVDLVRSVEEAGQARAERLQARSNAEEEIAAARGVFDDRGAALRGVDDELRQARHGLEEVREAGTRCEVALAEKRLRLDHLLEGVRNKYGLDLPEESAPLSAEEEQQASERLDSLREKLLRLGEVNVAAVDELRELEERAQFLRTQKEDLERSLDDLEKTIQKLNRASKTRFAETFAAVNERFQQVVPRLFRGGEARLVLTDENNILESGVDIVVRPPGKRLESMTLLSGGEKALVAVSLIFSLFLINPTPFCFLDEVDAPLDDANIGRFSDLVQEMSEHSQFIVITHNKRTMQAADVLYGVTMQEPGVSKVISVNMH